MLNNNDDDDAGGNVRIQLFCFVSLAQFGCKVSDFNEAVVCTHANQKMEFGKHHRRFSETMVFLLWSLNNLSF